MCGIHGVLTTSSGNRYSLTKFMEQAFITNAVRGMDSSGMFQIDRKKQAYYHKLALPGPFFIENKLTKAFLSDAGFASATVAHVRAATQGKVNIDNAHPFRAFKKDGSIILGVHNGTLTGWQYKPGARLFDVDSEWAINRIAEDGADAFEDFNGAYAFVWWNESAPDVIYMARNKERPLHFLLTEDSESMLFASEAGMLGWLADKNGIRVRNDEIHVLEEGKLYAFDLGGKTISWSKSNLPAAKPSYYSGSSTISNNGSYYGQGSTSSVGGSRSRGSEAAADGASCSVGGDASDGGDVSLPDKALLILEEFRRTLEAAPEAANQEQDDGDNSPGWDDNDNKVVPLDPPKGLNKKQRKAWRRRQQAAMSNNKEAEEVAKDLMGFGSDMDTVPEGYFNQYRATANEQANARQDGIYGRLQYFVGTYYDPESKELVGEIEDFIPGGVGRVRYEAVIPNIAAKEAMNLNELRGVNVVVVGKRGESNKDAGALVVTELSLEGVEKFAKALS